MTKLKAGIIDVFGESPLSGNPLAVVEDADALTDPQMRAVSREFNQAETTFLLRSSRADWKLRSFTAAGVEVFGAGHNSLGAWLWTGVEAEGCYVFAYDTENPGNAYARFFNPTVGLWEDSATGTAAGPLCGYLGWAGLLGPERALHVEQGVLMGRRSVLEVKLTPDPELSGSGAVVLEGEFSLANESRRLTLR
jgi:predicted PhzF superfamily epimerase YddE/YHI9